MGQSGAGSGLGVVDRAKSRWFVRTSRGCSASPDVSSIRNKHSRGAERCGPRRAGLRCSSTTTWPLSVQGKVGGALRNYCVWECARAIHGEKAGDHTRTPAAPGTLPAAWAAAARDGSKSAAPIGHLPGSPSSLTLVDRRGQPGDEGQGSDAAVGVVSGSAYCGPGSQEPRAPPQRRHRHCCQPHRFAGVQGAGAGGAGTRRVASRHLTAAGPCV